MPHLHTPGTPLPVTPEVMRAALAAAVEYPVLLLDDDRVVASDEDGLDLWVGVDLGCCCRLDVLTCAHQLLAAVRRGLPVAPTAPSPLFQRTIAGLRRQIRRHPAGRHVHASGDDTILPSHPMASESATLTHPGTTDSELAEFLDRDPALIWNIALLPRARRPGPLRDRIWAAWPTAAPLPPHRLLAILLDDEPDAAISRRLAPLTPPRLHELALALGALPPLAPRLARALPRPALAALLATTDDRDARLALARALSINPVR